MVTWRRPPSASGKSATWKPRPWGARNRSFQKENALFFFFFAEEKGTDAQREAEMRAHMNPETIRESGCLTVFQFLCSS